jgi:hypothetical protein
MRAHIWLAALLFFGILTLWVPAWWPVAAFQLGAFLLAGILLWRYRNGLPSPPFPVYALSAAVLWGLFQQFAGLTISPSETARATVGWAAALAFFFTAWIALRDSSARRQFLSAILWFGLLVSIWATLQTFTSAGKVAWIFPTEYDDAVLGPILSRNHYAAFMEALLPIALYRALRHRSDSLLYVAMAAAMYASVIASASRAGAVLATAETLLVVALMYFRGRVSAGAVGLTLGRMAALFTVFTLCVGWQAVWNRFWQPDPVTVRREYAISTLHMIRERPLAGFGLGTWPTAYPRYAVIDPGTYANQAHNDWLQWAAEGGIPFVAVFLLLFGWSVPRALTRIWPLGVISVFLHAAVDYPFSRPALAAVPLALLAASSACGPSRPGRDNPEDR